MSKNLSHLLHRKGIAENLMVQIQKSSRKNGKLSSAAIQELSDNHLIGAANIIGSSSFYDFLKPENETKKIYLCNGTACHVAGKQDALRAQVTKYFNENEIGNMCCLGRCHENSAFQYKGVNYSGLTNEQVTGILESKDLHPESKDLYAAHCYAPVPVLMDESLNKLSARAILSVLAKKSNHDWIKEIKISGLRGRGGAGYPMGLKIEACFNQEKEEKYVICNADEGDPGSYSDRYLLDFHPEKVLIGMLISGYILNAHAGVIYIRAEYPETVRQFEKHISYWNQQLDQFSNLKFRFKLIKGAGSYVVGEETSLLSSIEGQRPEVRVRPPYPIENGLYNCPTLVNNVETFASLPFIIVNGGDTYSELGTEESSGTKLVSLNGLFNRPGVYEVEMGVALENLLKTYGQGYREPVKALHIGGPLGGVVPVGEAGKLSLDFETFRKNGFELGHASIVAIPSTFPMIKYLEHLFEFVSVESCGKCFPCRLGAKKGWQMIKDAIHHNQKIDRKLFDELLFTLREGSLCGLGAGLPTPVRNILQHFEEEVKNFFNYE